MKSLTLLYILFLITSFLNAETYEFSSSKWGMSMEEAREVLGDKYDLQPVDESGNIKFFATIAGEEVTGVLYFEDYGLAMVALIFTDDVSENDFYSWSEAKRCYNTLATTLEKKYGVPHVSEYFNDPYYEGDGYELSALENGKGNYTRIWPKEGDSKNITLMIMGSGSVGIGYMSKTLQIQNKNTNSESLNEL